MKSLVDYANFVPFGRAPQGARGLKSEMLTDRLDSVPRRAPQGARGLKWELSTLIYAKDKVAPRKGRVD